MEQRRFSGNSHWYHETQSTLAPQTAPLIPEAAEIEDRFLLGLVQQYPDALRQTLAGSQPVLLASRDLYSLLLPQKLTTSKTHTLTLYDRLSTALTVAQVTGIQRLCNHYAARLNPLSGPDSSRESNRRLTQITEYARLLASQPTRVDAAALARLDEVGLSAPDIISFHQIIGFVCYQARIIAGLNALLALPVCWIPGTTLPEDAPAASISPAGTWASHLAPPHAGYLSEKQRDALSWSQPLFSHDACARLLVHDSDTLYGLANLLKATKEKQACAAEPLKATRHKRGGLTRSLKSSKAMQMDDAGQQKASNCPGAELALAAAVAARINGSPVCFQQHVPEVLRESLQQGVDEAAAVATAEQKAVIQCSAQLTRSPERFSAAHLQLLSEAKFSHSVMLDVVHSTALAGWVNRLMHALGSTVTADDTQV